MAKAFGKWRTTTKPGPDPSIYPALSWSTDGSLGPGWSSRSKRLARVRLTDEEAESVVDVPRGEAVAILNMPPETMILSASCVDDFWVDCVTLLVEHPRLDVFDGLTGTPRMSLGEFRAKCGEPNG